MRSEHHRGENNGHYGQMLVSLVCTYEGLHYLKNTKCQVLISWLLRLVLRCQAMKLNYSASNKGLNLILITSKPLAYTSGEAAARSKSSFKSVFKDRIPSSHSDHKTAVKTQFFSRKAP